MPFDPDEYLKEKDLEQSNKSTSAPGFDPDAYLRNPATGASVNPAPQAVTVGKEMAGLVPEAASSAGNLIKQGAQFVANRPLAATIADVGGVLTHGMPYGSMGNAAKNAIMGTGPTLGQTVANAKNILAGSGSAIAGGARAVGGAVAQGLTAPESLFALPYQGAAYEQERIRANPQGPLTNNNLITGKPQVVDTLQNNPYAQQYRGEYPTQGAAGAANARNALINQPYGGLTPQQQQMLQQDRQRQLDIQKQQQKKQQAQVILQQPPTAQNFIQRMTAMSDLYGDVNQG